MKSKMKRDSRAWEKYRVKKLKEAIVVKRYKRKCASCGKTLMLTENQISNGRLVCNNKCRIALSMNREEYVCLICGKKKTAPASAKRKYCSVKCHGIAFKNYQNNHPEMQQIAAQSRIGLPVSEERRLKNKIGTLNSWENGNMYEKLLVTRYFGNKKLNKKDKRLIAAYVLVFRIRRSINGKENRKNM